MSSIWNNRFPQIAPFWCKKDTVLQPDLPKEKNPTLARHLISRFLWSRFYLLSRISLPKVMLNAASRLLQTTYPQPSLFEWREVGPSTSFPKLWGEYGTSEKGESWTQRGAREGYDENEDKTQPESDGKEKERKLHFFFSSHHSYRPLSLTINSNIPKKWSRATGDKAGEGRGRLYVQEL